MACSDTKEPSRVSLAGPAAVVILAAGEGTRMKNHTPKVLNEVCGRTMLGHVVAAARELGPERLIVVTGHGRGQVAEYLAQHAPEDNDETLRDRKSTRLNSSHANISYAVFCLQ